MERIVSVIRAIEVRERPSNHAIRDSLIEEGCQPVVADVLSRRLDYVMTAQEVLAPSLASIPDPASIPDMSLAVERISRAIVDRERVALAVDHDMDGQASAAVLWNALTQYFGVDEALLQIVTSHRLTEGYGITDAVVDRIVRSGAKLVISADKGSSDEPRIQRLTAAGIDVVVTDHHEIPDEGPPKSAFACVNPARRDSPYNPYVCGAGVAFLTMAKVRSRLLLMGHRKEIPSLSSLCDFVAVATIADCVALRPDKSSVNRALIRAGLQAINLGTRACWRVFKRSLRDEGPITSQSVAFSLAPAIAAAGRLDWAEDGFRFLIARSEPEAELSWAVLTQENEQRKRLESDVRRAASGLAEGQKGSAISVLVERGHSGVHGITASRLVERFGKPVGIFSPKGAGARTSDGDMAVGSTDVVTGSFRSVPAVHIRDALQKVEDENPGMLISFGGHAGAAGASLRRDRFADFQMAFEKAVGELARGAELAPMLWSDGKLPVEQICIDSAESLGELDPWGKDFPPPTFCGNFAVVRCTPMGDGSHWRLQLQMGVRLFEAVWFSATPPGANPPVTARDSVEFAYRITSKWYRGAKSLQLEVMGVVAAR